MTLRTFLPIFSLAAITAMAAGRPNVVIIYADDLGYGSLSCYGNTAYETPHLDAMAAKGARMTSFYVATPSCGPSRVALLTGRFPFRTGVPSNPAPDANRNHGIKASETTLAELFKTKGYATKIVGKWHLGHLPEHYPTRHGFDSYFGILYSNDMRPVMLCRDEEAAEYPVVQNYLTKRYTEEALAFIDRHGRAQGLAEGANAGAATPFFLYFPHAMPHKPLAASEAFYTPETRDDLYADVIRELDWSVGQVLGKLAELGLEEETLVLFSSDNGPWYGGTTGGLRGMKGSGWEGGCRVPGIFQWAGKIPGGRAIDEPCATIDVFPTVCGLLGIDASKFAVDGHDIWPLLSGKGAGPEREIYVWNGINLLALRQGRWKFHWTAPRARFRGKKDEVWRDERGPDGVTIIAPNEQNRPWQYPSPADTASTAPSKAMQLFDLEEDRGEQVDVTAKYPEVVARLKEIAADAVEEAKTVEQPKLGKRPQTIFFRGPGRITEDDGVSIEEALRRTRENGSAVIEGTRP